MSWRLCLHGRCFNYSLVLFLLRPFPAKTSDNTPFNSLNNNELFDLFRPNPCNNDANIDNTATYDDSVANEINSSSEELVFDFDYDDPAQTTLTTYVTNNQFHNIVNNFDANIFSLFHLNIRSLNMHFDDLQLLLDNPSFKPLCAIGLTETWLSHDSNLPYSLDPYNFVFNNRQGRAGGGVALYLLKQFHYNVLRNISVSNAFVETLFVEILIPGHKNIIIGVVYRPPNASVNDFLSYLSDMLHNPIFNNKDCFVMGDFNINLLKQDTHISKDFLNTFLSASYLPLITKPTRVANQSATLIDNIFSNVIPHPNSHIILSDITDHYPIMTHYIVSQTVNNGSYPLRRKITNENIARLDAGLDYIDWSPIYDDEDVDTCYNTFCNILNEQLDLYIPLQRDKNNYKKSPRLPWISKSLLRSINRKNNLFYKFKLEGTEKARNKYTSYKNIVTHIIRLEKKKYFETRLALYKHDMQNTWKIIKQAMNLHDKKCDLTKIKFNNELIEDPVNIANVFNNYFSSIGENLARDIPPSNKQFVDFLDQPNPNSMFLLPTNRNEIISIVSKLHNKKSSGYDGFNSFILKKIILSIVDPLVHIFNLSLSNGQVPDSMKIAKVIPLFKKGDKLDIKNYRPISLLSSFSKVLEKIIYIRTISFFKFYDILSNTQFGFREKHSTIHALLSFIDKAAHSFDRSSHMIGIFLDFAKAFDTINHDILLYKLSHYGVRGKALEWFRSYLSIRKQYVFLNNHSSEFCNINCGVPQGSILGPLLFIIYINDFCRSSDILSFIHFADDTNLFFSHHDPLVLAEIVNFELIKVLQWIRANKLSLNLQKTKYMLFSKSIESLPINISFEDYPLECVSSIKFLGVTVDDKLSWKNHIENICNKISRNIGVINKLKTCLPLKSLLMLYSSLILPYLNYALMAWGNAHRSILDKLLLLQKKVVRIICNSAPRSHADPLFFDNKLLKINDLYLFQLGQFMYNYNRNLLPSTFNDMFMKNQSFHNYPTRHSGEFHLPRLRTLSAQNTFFYEGPKFWNSLKDEIKDSPSLNSFKNKLKLFLLQQYSSN